MQLLVVPIELHQSWSRDFMKDKLGNQIKKFKSCLPDHFLKSAAMADFTFYILVAVFILN